MTAVTAVRPDPGAYAPYYRRYVERVPEGDVLRTLEGQLAATLAVVRAFQPGREEHRYAPDKWSVREVVGHAVDAERVFALRALWFARGAASEQPGYDENAWAQRSNAGARPLDDLVGEWRAVRGATLALFRGLDADAWGRSGRANGVDFTVGSLAWFIAGHELHHRAILGERYGAGVDG